MKKIMKKIKNQKLKIVKLTPAYDKVPVEKKSTDYTAYRDTLNPVIDKYIDAGYKYLADSYEQGDDSFTVVFIRA
jgi:hypothetical protein